MAPITGRVLNKVFWLMKIAKPFGQFLKTDFQFKGWVPRPIILNIREKVAYDKLIENKMSKINAKRSTAESTGLL
jgi:hypothetical protein